MRRSRHARHESRHAACSEGNWGLLNIAAMVFGFIFWWPLGLAVLFYNIFAQPGDLRRWFAKAVAFARRHIAPLFSREGAARRRHVDDRLHEVRRRLEIDLVEFREARARWRRWMERRQA